MRSRKFTSLIGLLLALMMLVSAAVPVFAANVDTSKGMTFTADTIYQTDSVVSTPIHTFEATVYFPADTASTVRGGAILGNYQDNTKKYISFEIHQNGNPRVCAIYENNVNSSFSYIFNNVNVYNGKQTHVAIALDKDGAKCYINGELKQTISYSSAPSISLDRPLNLGGDMRTNNECYFKGQISRAAAYSDVRTPVEILSDVTSFGSDDLLMSYDTPYSATAPLIVKNAAGSKYNMINTAKKDQLGMSFTASNSYQANIDATPRTFEANVCFPTKPSDRGGVIIGNYNGADTCVNFEIYSNGQPRLYMYDRSTKAMYSYIFTSVNVFTGQAHHVAIVLADSGVQCYVDGELKQTISYTGARPSISFATTPVHLGGDGRANNTSYFLGNIRDVAVYSDARNADEVLADVTAYGTEDLIVRYSTPYTTSAPAEIEDLSGNGYDMIDTNQIDTTQVGMKFTADTVYSPVNTMTTASRTFEASIYFPKNTTGRGGVILGNYRTNNDKYINFEITDGGVPRLNGRTANIGNTTTNPSNSFNILFSNVNVYQGKQLHLAIVLEATEAKCYVDGVLKQTVTYATAGTSEANVLIGADRPIKLGGDDRSGNAQYFKGQICSVATYADARTAAEVLTDVTAYGKEDLLLKYTTPYSETAPEKFTDESGNGFDMMHIIRWVDPADKTPVESYDYTFAVVGDTQNINYLYPTDYSKIYDWIVANKTSKNIQYVLGLGDITEKPENTDEWARAIAEMAKLDKAGIPYSLTIGNDTHDTSAKFNEAFNKSPYTDSIGGLYTDSQIENSWRKITVGTNGIKYLIITLDWKVTDEELQWASDVIAANPDYNVIITTHAYLYRDGTTFDKDDLWGPTYGGYNPDANDGDRIWEKLIKKHENIVLVMSGHDPTEQIVMTQSTGVNGNVVTQLLIDPQDIDKTEQSAGMVALLHFSADGSKVTVEYYSTVKEKYFLNTNQFSFDIDVVTPKNHSISLSLGKDIKVNHYVKNDNYTDPKVRFTLNGYTQTVNGVLDGEEYKFVFTGVAPQWIGDTIKAELLIDGEVVKTDTYTVLDYLNALKGMSAEQLGYSTEKYNTLQTLINDLLVYGGAAQTYTGHNTDKLVSEGITGTTFVTITSTDTTVSNGSYVTFKNATVHFDSVNKLKFQITAASLDGITFKIRKAGGVESVIECKDNGDGTYIITSDGIYANGFDDVYTITAYKNGVADATATYSVKSYVYSMQEKETAMGALARATYNYGLSAKAFQNAQ